MSAKRTPTTIVQTAYYVPDARQAAAHWSRCFGAGPFFLLSHIPLTDVLARGQPSTFDHTSAYGWQGEQMVELVQQNCATPSIFNDRPYGLHHLAHFVDDLEEGLATYRALDMPTAMQAVAGGGTQFAFVDANASHGHYFEIYQRSAGILEFYEMVERAALGWRGEQPLREL